MKKWLAFSGLVFCASLSFGADLTYPNTTPNGQAYNSPVRDLLDGTNVPVMDTVSASTYSVVNTTTVVKATPGFVAGITVSNFQTPNTCTNPLPIKILNTASAPTAATQPILMLSSSTVVNGYIPINARFATGLTVGIDATCVTVPTVNVYFR